MIIIKEKKYRAAGFSVETVNQPDEQWPGQTRLRYSCFVNVIFMIWNPCQPCQRRQKTKGILIQSVEAIPEFNAGQTSMELCKQGCFAKPGAGAKNSEAGVLSLQRDHQAGPRHSAGRVGRLELFNKRAAWQL
ncbi:MAG: hypothetical protein M1309_02850 [Actinobacteria bacterium]|nr:hypothetical protein [Actinomycetota bacterium]